MALEIEKKFLAYEGAWRQAKATRCRQGYLSVDPERTVRVRRINNQGYLTVKGVSQGAARMEYEYEIPAADAEAMLNDLCKKPLIEKMRYTIEHQGLVWEVDEFFGENQGLIVAEVELEKENQTFVKPEWIGKEVTEDPKYFNANLIDNPFGKW